MSDMLTQEAIDAMMNGNEDDSSKRNNELTQDQKDIIGEVGNISMSQAATTLSSLLNKEVKITTPIVSQSTIKSILEESDYPKVVTSIDFKYGLDGSNMLMIDVPDAIIIADLMMGNDGTDVSDNVFGELELSAVGEAMNQMIGTASTAMATMFSRKVDIEPPHVEVLEMEADEEMIQISTDTPVVSISFELKVEGLINSRISQIFSDSTVLEINDIMLSDKAVTISDRVAQPEEEMKVAETKPVIEKTQREQVKVEVQKPDFLELSDVGQTDVPRNLDLIMDVPLEFTVVLGKSRKTIKDILSLGAGSVVELDKMTDEPLEILVNGKLIAKGEVVVINESFGIRITNIVSKEERIKKIN